MQHPTRRPVRVVIAAGDAMRHTLRDAVARAGMQIAAECADSSELFAAVARERPDVCLLDRDLRGGSLIATAAITTPQRAPRVVIVGGRGARAEVRAARLAGATECLPVDVDAEDLAAAVAALVRTDKEEQ
jgi:DNA-binding NarL/FixJ family response regulator